MVLDGYPCRVQKVHRQSQIVQIVTALSRGVTILESSISADAAQMKREDLLEGCVN